MYQTIGDVLVCRSATKSNHDRRRPKIGCRLLAASLPRSSSCSSCGKQTCGMGAKCLYQIQVESTTTASIAERELIRRVEAHTGRRIGSWEVTYSLYGPSAGSEKRNVLESVTSTEIPNRVVLISNTRVVESEDKFSTSQLSKLATFKQRSTRMIRGVAYDFVDFIVRVGLVFDRHNSASGVAVEIEYAPCAVVDDCAELIKELMERIATALVPPPQAGHETMVAKAAATSFRFAPVLVNFKQYFTTEKPFFTLRHSMLLYRKLLADPDTEPRPQ